MCVCVCMCACVLICMCVCVCDHHHHHHHHSQVHSGCRLGQVPLAMTCMVYTSDSPPVPVPLVGPVRCARCGNRKASLEPGTRTMRCRGSVAMQMSLCHAGATLRRGSGLSRPTRAAFRLCTPSRSCWRFVCSCSTWR